jgi:hypothetical protein
LNGNKENIEYTNLKNINTSSYKEMLSIYNQTKEQYKNQSVTIDFVGITSDEQVKVLFSKKIKNENDDNFNSFELIDDLHFKTIMLKKRKYFISKQLGIIEKEKNVFEHKNIEFYDINLLTDEYKIQAFDEYRRILLDRRNIKNENENLNNVSEHIDIIIDNINAMFNRTRGLLNSKEKCTSSAIKNEVPENKDKQLIKEYSYKTDKERIHLMAQMQKKYKKVINDEINKKLICYSKSIA